MISTDKQRINEHIRNGRSIDEATSDNSINDAIDTHLALASLLLKERVKIPKMNVGKLAQVEDEIMLIYRKISHLALTPKSRVSDKAEEFLNVIEDTLKMEEEPTLKKLKRRPTLRPTKPLVKPNLPDGRMLNRHNPEPFDIIALIVGIFILLDVLLIGVLFISGGFDALVQRASVVLGILGLTEIVLLNHIKGESK